MRRVVFGVLLSALCACPVPPQTQASKPAPAAPIRIGFIGALTGPNAAYGITSQSGVDLAVAQANAAGGVLGRKLLVLHEDSQSRPEQAREAALKLITEGKVNVLIGPTTSDDALIVAPVAERARIAMITPGATHKEVTRIGPHIFRACFNDAFQGLAMARFTHGELKFTKVAVLRNVHNQYAQSLSDAFKREFAKVGGALVADEAYAAADTDFGPALSRIRAAAPQALYIPGYHVEVARIARLARDAGYTGVLLGGDGWGSRELRSNATAAIEGSYYTDHHHSAQPDTANQHFVKQYRTRFNEVPDPTAALGYDAARIAIAAIGRAGRVDRAAIRTALATTRKVDSVTGAITLDTNGDAQKPAIIVRIEKGQPVFVTRIAPTP